MTTSSGRTQTPAPVAGKVDLMASIRGGMVTLLAYHFIIDTP
jgi:hypothetical protein